MRAAGVALGLLAALAGAVWVAQGLNLPMAPHSFMTAVSIAISMMALIVSEVLARRLNQRAAGFT